MESKVTATRFFLRSFYLFGLSFSSGFSVIHSQNQDFVIFLTRISTRTHTTILVYIRTSHYKFVYVWKLPRLLLHQIIVHRQRTLTTWKPFISTKNLGILRTASVRISIG